MSQRALARVDLAAVERNCTVLRRQLGAKSQLCAVVKAFGYGHGAVSCARAALAGGRDGKPRSSAARASMPVSS